MRKVSLIVLLLFLFPTLCLAQSVVTQANALSGTEWGMDDFPGISLGFHEETVYFCTSAKKLSFPDSNVVNLFIVSIFFAHDNEIRTYGMAINNKGTAVLCSLNGCMRSPISKLNDSFMPPEE